MYRNFVIPGLPAEIGQRASTELARFLQLSQRTVRTATEADAQILASLALVYAMQPDRLVQ